MKIQAIDYLAKNPRAKGIIVGDRLMAVSKKDNLKFVVKNLGLSSILSKKVGELSGGELQRFTIGMTCI